MTFSMKHISLSALAAALWAGIANANLITNGSFETPDLAPAVAQGYATGSTAITGWTVLGSPDNTAAISILTNSYGEDVGGSPDPSGPVRFAAEDGVQSLDLTGPFNQGPLSGIDQVVATTVGQAYALTFYVGNQDDALPNYGAASSVLLTVTGHPSKAFTTDMNTTDNVTWQEFTYDFVATSTSTTIAFTNNTVDDNYAGLDNVDLELGKPVPEPSTWMMMCLGFAGLGFAGYRASRRTAASI